MEDAASIGPDPDGIGPVMTWHGKPDRNVAVRSSAPADCTKETLRITGTAATIFGPSKRDADSVAGSEICRRTGSRSDPESSSHFLWEERWEGINLQVEIDASHRLQQKIGQTQSKGDNQVKLDVRAFASAQTVGAAILYVVCSFFVGLMPAAAARLAGYVLHADLSGLMRPLSVSSFVVGLLVVSIGWGLLSLFMASVYNSLTKNAVPNHFQQKI